MDIPSKLENLSFARSMLRELARRTDAADEKLLTYLIEMASAEADDRIEALSQGQASRERF
ncbi:hypothetical protein FJ987_04635 [Mesorhizobium sp. CU2]|uniref:hypothetical protein n=1 Tax=Mesorhizobium sp. CU2 TaxID=2589985 RepID=UPI00112B8C3E|nr:hypothetical protein [Mesorhizobium sp. CU2]TPN86636.1 hypothetical protein FJ988_07650 [Mesorhizobium sp. CU3]TPO20430.1 hypothetical protein FJ987_04635 [Mesorhizobium sp. CU2]